MWTLFFQECYLCLLSVPRKTDPYNGSSRITDCKNLHPDLRRIFPRNLLTDRWSSHVELSLHNRRCVKYRAQIPLKYKSKNHPRVSNICWNCMRHSTTSSACMIQLPRPSENPTQPKNWPNELINHAVSIWRSFVLFLLPESSSRPLFIEICASVVIVTKRNWLL